MTSGKLKQTDAETGVKKEVVFYKLNIQNNKFKIL